MFINCRFITYLTEGIHGRVGSNVGESGASFQPPRWAKHQPTRVPAVADLFVSHLGKKGGGGCARFSFFSSHCSTRTWRHYFNPMRWRSLLESPVRCSVPLRPLLALGPQLWPRTTGRWWVGREARRGTESRGSQNCPQCQFNVHLLCHGAPGAEAWAQRPTMRPSCSHSACPVSLISMP